MVPPVVTPCIPSSQDLFDQPEREKDHCERADDDKDEEGTD